MRTIDYFNRDPNGKGWLKKLGLKPGELVKVNGQVYRYSVEREGREHVLTPVR